MVLPSTVVGLLLIVVIVLPGCSYIWAYERQVSAYGVTLADRTLRFIAVSLLFHAIFAWPEYVVHRVAIEGRSEIATAQFALLWGGALCLLGLPATLGTVLGGLYATRTHRTGWERVRRHLTAEREKHLLRFALGRAPAPRAWDNFFSERPNVYIRVRLADGVWIGGRFADQSYAGGFPHDADLYLEEAWAVDQASGAFIGDRGLGIPVYVPAGQIVWMEIDPEQNDESEEVATNG